MTQDGHDVAKLHLSLSLSYKVFLIWLLLTSIPLYGT
jgi:hypothetical protein